MKIAVWGTGDVGRTVGGKLIELGHEVCIGARSSDNPTAARWVAEHGALASQGTFAEAAGRADVIVNCSSGLHSVAIVESLDAGRLDGKLLVDISNPLDFSQGFPPSLSICNDDSLAEAIQRAAPGAKVVKALNTMWNGLMVDPRQLPERHTTFICGNDTEAKDRVRALLGSFGWYEDEIFDLGELSQARGVEMWLPLWVRIYAKSGTARFNLKLVFADADT